MSCIPAGSVKPDRIRQIVSHLTNTIGVRVAGSKEERETAEYLDNELRKYTSRCEMESFIAYSCPGEECLEICLDDHWKQIPALWMNPSADTGNGLLNGEIIFFDSHTDYQRRDLSLLKGKAVLHFGLVNVEDDYRRLVESQPAFVMMVDTRYTTGTPVSNAFLPAFIDRYGSVPAVSISYWDAWDFMTKGASLARLQIVGRQCKKNSQNLIASIPGSDPNAGWFYLCAHMDSVPRSPGADDNAVGCAILVELARVLSQRNYRHGLKFIAFGTEEQLSVGSAEYVRRHREELMEKGRFVWNFDSCAGALSWNYFSVNAQFALKACVDEVLHKNGVYYQPSALPDPYNDLFPFTAVGVPGITFLRKACDSGKFYHHQPNNTLDVLSMDVAAQLASTAVDMLDTLDKLKQFDTDPAVETDVSRLWDSLYGGWQVEG